MAFMNTKNKIKPADSANAFQILPSLGLHLNGFIPIIICTTNWDKTTVTAISLNALSCNLKAAKITIKLQVS